MNFSTSEIISLLSTQEKEVLEIRKNVQLKFLIWTTLPFVNQNGTASAKIQEITLTLVCGQRQTKKTLCFVFLKMMKHLLNFMILIKICINCIICISQEFITSIIIWCKNWRNVKVLINATHIKQKLIVYLFFSRCHSFIIRRKYISKIKYNQISAISSQNAFLYSP